MKKLIILLLFPLFLFSQDCYLSSNNSDPKANFKAWCDCIDADKEVVFSGTFEVYADKTFFTNNDIIVKGAGKEKSKLVFLNPTLYFDSDKGVNMSFENISIATGNYEKFKNDSYLTKTKFSDFYRLQDISAADKTVDIEFIGIKNCFIGGSLQILLGGNLKDYEETKGNAAGAIGDFHTIRRKEGVDRLTIEDNYIEYPYVLASVSAFPKETNINRNIVYNLRQAMVKVSYADNVNYNDNHIKNDFIALPGMSHKSGYISGLVALGANKLEGRRNSMTNVLASSGCEVSHVFPSVRNFIWEDSKTIDSFNLHEFQGIEINLVKLKQCENIKLFRNDFTITREGYYKMGLIEHIDSPIESVSTHHYTSLLSPSNDYVPGFTAYIVDNVFSIPHINRASLIMSDNNTIEGNTINVEYMAPMEYPLVPSRYNKPNAIYSVEGGERGYFKHSNNTYNIAVCYNNECNVVDFEKVSHNIVENCDNKYYFTQPTKLNFGGKESGKKGHICRNYKATGNFINKGSLEDVSGIIFENFKYPYTESNYVDYTVGISEGKTAETHIANLESFGKTSVEVLQNNSNTFGVFRFLYSDFVSKTLNDYFKTKSVNIIVKIIALNADGIEETLSYKILVKDRVLLYSDSKYPAIDKTQLFKKSVSNTENKNSLINLVHRNYKAGDVSYLTFEGLKDCKSFSVSVNLFK